MWPVAALAWIAFLASPAAAQDRPRVAVDLRAGGPPCSEETRDQLMRVIRAELGPSVETHSAGGDAGMTTQVTATCGAEGVRIRVDDPITGKSLERSIRLTAAATPVQVRILGLAIVELVAASWIELELRTQERQRRTDADRPRPGATRTAVAIARGRRSQPAHRRVRLEASVGERRHQNQLAMRSVGIRTSYRAGALSLAVDSEFGSGERRIDTGSVEVSLLGAGARAMAHVALEQLLIGAGLELRGGAARLRGRSLVAAQELSFWAPVATMSALVTITGPASDRWFLHVDVEAGAVIAGVNATVSNTPTKVYRGRFVGVSTGIGMAF